MPKQLGKVGTVRRELEGSACPSCGSSKYQLVLRCQVGTESGGLYARCSGCQTNRDIHCDDILTRTLKGKS